MSLPIIVKSDSVRMHEYIAAWAGNSPRPGNLEHYQAWMDEMHGMAWEAIFDGGYSETETVETFPYVEDFTEYGWQQCEHWRSSFLRWLYSARHGIPAHDRRRFEMEEVIL